MTILPLMFTLNEFWVIIEESNKFAESRRERNRDRKLPKLFLINYEIFSLSSSLILMIVSIYTFHHTQCLKVHLEIRVNIFSYRILFFSVYYNLIFVFFYYIKYLNFTPKFPHVRVYVGWYDKRLF